MNRQDYLTEFFRALGPISDAERDQIADYYNELVCDRLEQGMTEEEAVLQLGDPAEAAVAFRELYTAEESDPTPEQSVTVVEEASALTTLDFAVENLRIIVQGIAGGSELPSIQFQSNPEFDEIHTETRNGVFYYRHKIRKNVGMSLLRFFKSPELRDFVVRIPASWKGTLLLKTCNGPISVSGVEDMQKLGMTTSNGRLELRDLSASQIEAKSGNAQVVLQNIGAINLEAVTSNGKIDADGIRTTKLFLHTTNGAMRLQDLQADNLQAETSNGKIETDGIQTNDLKLHTTNGSMLLQNLNSSNIHAETSNGRIEAVKCFASEELGLFSTSGAVTLEKSKAESIFLTSSNARLTVDQIEAPQIKLRSSNGGISGTVLGNAEDYETEARTTNGSCNLPNLSGTGRPKHLTAVTSNARIQIEFCPVGE